MHTGPNIKRDGLVFGYDTGYSSINENLSKGRYFKGPTSTNLLQRLNTSYSNTQTSNFYAVAGEETVKIPKIGRRTVKYVEYFNNHPSSGNCCPNLFNYGEATVTSNTSYTYSIVYKHTGNYTHPNFMYRYEYNGGTYNTEGGFHSTASDRRRSLGNGWFHAWGTFTTQATTNRLICYSFLYNYGTTKYKFYVAAISIVRNTTGTSHLIVPPHLILQPTTSISSTQSLIDLTRTTTIDVSNVSFDSTGQPTFDGTNDVITTSFPATTISNVTIEAVVYRNQATGRYEAIVQNNVVSDDALYINPSGYLMFWPCASSSLTVPTGQWSHVAVSYNGTTLTYIVNGTIQVVTATCSDITDWDFLRIGGHGTTDSERWIGKIAVAKVYEKSLSAAELTQNYRAYKNRFDI
jgi:hypothetical protein